MKRKWIFLFTTSLLLLSYTAKASYAYYEDSSEEDQEISEEEYQEAIQNSETESKSNMEQMAQRLTEEQLKLSELANSIDVKLPLDKELEASLEANESDSTDVKQSAVSRKPAIKENEQSNFEDGMNEDSSESDEVSLSNSAIQKPNIPKENLKYQTRRLRSR